MKRTKKDKTISFRLPDALPKSSLSMYSINDGTDGDVCVLQPSTHPAIFSLPGSPGRNCQSLCDPPGILSLSFRKGRMVLSFLPKLCSLQEAYHFSFPHNPPLTLGGMILVVGKVGRVGD